MTPEPLVPAPSAPPVVGAEDVAELVETLNRIAEERDAFRNERNDARAEVGRLRAQVEAVETERDNLRAALRDHDQVRADLAAERESPDSRRPCVTANRGTAMSDGCVSFSGRSGKPCAGRVEYEVDVPGFAIATSTGYRVCKRHLAEWVDTAARQLQRHGYEPDEPISVRLVKPVPPDGLDSLAAAAATPEGEGE